MDEDQPTLRIPVRFTADGLELFYGGRVPITPGTIGELRVPPGAIKDQALLASLTEGRVVPVLSEGTELRIVMRWRAPLGETLDKLFIHADDMPHERPQRMGSHYGFVPVHLGPARQRALALPEQPGGLMLLLKGAHPIGIRTGHIRMPPIGGLRTAISLNHAYTQLSTIFESWRASHTGNIYRYVYYREPGKDGAADRWYPIGDLRDRELANTERRVIAAAWKRLQSELRLNPGGG